MAPDQNMWNNEPYLSQQKGLSCNQGDIPLELLASFNSKNDSWQLKGFSFEYKKNDPPMVGEACRGSPKLKGATKL